MKNINELMSSLNNYFGWNKFRMQCFAQLLLGLISVRTVNLQEIALSIQSPAQLTSRYRRLQRFFALFEMDFTVLARYLFKLFLANTEKFYVLIDRTNWYWGKQKINVFVLSVAYEGLAIPLFWNVLPKGGSSNFKEQKVLINRFIEAFGTRNIAGLLGDREFASGKLFRWLSKKNIAFYIRIKEGSQVCVGKKKMWTAKKLFKYVNPKSCQQFHMRVKVFGADVYLSGSRSEHKGELMIVASNQPCKEAIAIYLRRWEIESLFQGLKGRGFCFEDTHMTHPDRIAKLMGLLAVAFAWAHKVGEWKALRIPIIWKKFKNKQRRPQYTFFRYGLDHIREIILHGTSKFQSFKECIRLLVFKENPRTTV